MSGMTNEDLRRYLDRGEIERPLLDEIDALRAENAGLRAKIDLLEQDLDADGTGGLPL